MDATSTGPGNYEFSGTENAVISKTARWTKIWGWLWLAGGTLMVALGLLALPAGVVNMIFGAIYLLIGWYFKRAGESLQAVVETSGNDIAHLMTGLEKLGSVFKTTMIIALVGIALAVVAFIAIGSAAMAMQG